MQIDMMVEPCQVCGLPTHKHLMCESCHSTLIAGAVIEHVAKKGREMSMSAALDRMRQEMPGYSTQLNERMADVYARKYGVTRKTVLNVGLDQLELCRSDEARRLLMGVGKRFSPDEIQLLKKGLDNDGNTR